ncbi:MAG: homoaconitate hydratase [Anaerolineae bacterium]|jgi:methanogen homoaconitase small subunit|nr:homoaconitate hydratase [Chloroflexota bacterium]
MATVWVFGDDVDTDQIVPGRYAPYMNAESELGKYPFIEARPEFAREVQRGDVIVAGRNFGCGSSREYAPRALYVVGVAAVIAPSFARIFFRNSLNLGLRLIQADLRDAVSDREPVELDWEHSVLRAGDRALALPAAPGWLRAAWDEGGIVHYYLAHGRLPVEASQ